MSTSELLFASFSDLRLEQNVSHENDLFFFRIMKCLVLREDSFLPQRQKSTWNWSVHPWAGTALFIYLFIYLFLQQFAVYYLCATCMLMHALITIVDFISEFVRQTTDTLDVSRDDGLLILFGTLCIWDSLTISCHWSISPSLCHKSDMSLCASAE